MRRGTWSGGDRPDSTLLAAGLDDEALAVLEAMGFRLRERERLGALGLAVLTLEPPLGMPPDEAAGQLQRRFPQAVVDFDHAYAPQEAEDTCGADCWPRRLIAWPPPGRCPASVPLALLDGLPQSDHPDLAGAGVRLHPLTGQDAAAGHATALAILLVGPRIGLLPGASLDAIGIYRRTADGPRARVRDLVRGLDRALALGARVAVFATAGPPNRLLALAVRQARARGLWMVAPVGNGGPYAPPAHPAALREVVAVTAVDRRLEPYAAAGQGPHVDFAAPGVALPLRDAEGRPRPRSGTSFAVPFVAAAVALALAHGAGDPSTLLRDLAVNALDLGPPGRDPLFGYGLIRPPTPCRATLAVHGG